MNRNQAKKFYPILQAFAEGKIIEMSSILGWVKKDDLNIDLLMSNPELFRIKPEANYRPFKNVEECWHEMLKHQPFGWVKTDSGYEPIWHVNEGDDFNETFKYSTFADGTPFGIKEEK